jgi:hypothetical protein
LINLLPILADDKEENLFQTLSHQKIHCPDFDNIIVNKTDMHFIDFPLTVNDKKIPIKVQKISENTSIFEGDVLIHKITAPNGKAAYQNFKYEDSKPWTNGNVSIAICENLPNTTRTNFYKAIFQIVKLFDVENIPINFLPSDNTEANKLYITPTTSACYSSFIGMNPKYGGGSLHLSKNCMPPDIIHEIGHTLGLWHEQTRCNEKEKIKIIEKNIRPEALSQFQAKCNSNDLANIPLSYGEYDYCSIMHYRNFVNEIFAIDPRKPVMKPIGQVTCGGIGEGENFSKGDLAALYKIYEFAERKNY